MSYSDMHSFLYNTPSRRNTHANMSPHSGSFDLKHLSLIDEVISFNLDISTDFKWTI